MLANAERIAKALYLLVATVLVVGAAGLCLAFLPFIGAVLMFALLIVVLGWALNLAIPIFLAAGFAGSGIAALVNRLRR